MASRSRLRVFLDVDVFIRGTTLPRFPYEVLRHAAQGDIIVVTSPGVLSDARAYIHRLFLAFVETEFELLLGSLELEIVSDPSPEEVVASAGLVRDQKDIPVALAAIQARVDYLVTTDTDFTDDDNSTARLREHLKPIRVGSFLHEVMGWDSRDLAAIERRSWSEIWPPFWRASE